MNVTTPGFLIIFGFYLLMLLGYCDRLTVQLSELGMVPQLHLVDRAVAFSSSPS